MHQAQEFFNKTLNPNNTTPLSITLNASTATALEVALVADAQSYIYSSIVSLGDAIQGINREMFSWATVKLYYSAFYALRAALAAHGYAIIYYQNGNKNTPYGLMSTTNSIPEKLKYNTHKLVLLEYAKKFSTETIVTQLIGNEYPFNWLMNRREEANYKNARFPEPSAPSFYAKFLGVDLNALLLTYINDKGKYYAFDPDHAIVALPIAAIQAALLSFTKKNPKIKMPDSDINYLASLFAPSNNGSVLPLENLFL